MRSFAFAAAESGKKTNPIVSISARVCSEWKFSWRRMKKKWEKEFGGYFIIHISFFFVTHGGVRERKANTNQTNEKHCLTWLTLLLRLCRSQTIYHIRKRNNRRARFTPMQSVWYQCTCTPFLTAFILLTPISAVTFLTQMRGIVCIKCPSRYHEPTNPTPDVSSRIRNILFVRIRRRITGH